MNILRLEYSVWKAMCQAGALATTHKPTGKANRVTVWAGNATDILWGTVDPDDYADWASSFPASILVTNADEAYAKLIEAASGGAISNNNEIVVNIANTGADTEGCIPGDKVRYDFDTTKIDLNNKNEAYSTVYEITEASVFYKIAFQLNSDNICMQVEVDGEDIFPSGGLCFEDMQDLCFGSGGGGSGSGSGSGGGTGTNPIGLFEYDANKWVWQPPKPMCVATNMKIKMRASTSSNSTDYKKGLAVRRSLV